MIGDFLSNLLELLRELFQRLKASRLFLLSCVYTCLVAVLVLRLYHLQILEGESYLKDYIQMTEKTVSIPATRGNIFDCNGKLLAYNRLSYCVTVQDTGDYRTAAERNGMLLRLVRILNKYGETVTGRFEVGIGEDGSYVFTSANEDARKRFLRDVYGLRRVEELTGSSGKYPSDITAEELIAQRVKYYGLDRLKEKDGSPVVLTPLETAELVNIRYTMGLTAYQRYDPTLVVNRVSEEARMELVESRADLLGVSCEPTTERVYNDSIPFSSIIGYVGRVQEDQLSKLQELNSDYNLSDIVGRTGIEEYMEQELHGRKGQRSMYVDNVGHVMEVKSETSPTAGNDIFLSIDRDLQVGIYQILEQHLAGVLAAKLVNEDEPNTERTDSTERLIPIKDAYYQLIGNNVLSVSRFRSPDASEAEKRIAEKLDAYRESSIAGMRSELMNPDALPVSALPDDQKAFMYYLYTMLSSDNTGIIVKGRIDTTGEYYTRWKEDSISLREFLYQGISDGFVDTTGLNTGSRYSGAEEVYRTLVDQVTEGLGSDAQFEKLLLRYMIRGGLVEGKELCIALYEQGVLPYEEEEVRLLEENGPDYAFEFFVRQVSDLRLTPAQLALDPCTAGCVVTDVRTGKVKALVSYPGYDNNRLTNVMDVEYYNRIVNDESLPLYNNATQARKAPGSTFKPITAIAGLEEQVLGLTDTINCTGIYDTITPPMRCWIYPGAHGTENIVEAIRNSCNFFFADVGHRLATGARGEYDTSLGLGRIRKYATMFGLDRKSGVEVIENDPMISDESPEQSSIGQGTHSFANVQLSRYVTAIANRGTVFNLSILDHVSDWQGELLYAVEPDVTEQIQIQPSTWNAVQRGMREVIEFGSARRLFTDLEVNIAGKTGTAQESRNRANHAFFISFGPFENPQLAVTVNIPYGYTSTNAAAVSKDVYRLCFGYTSLEYVLNTGAQSASSVKIQD